ncbi:MAG: ribonuclease HII [Deltaproteobacteria bacterium]|nr:ribonuclease HII [Deltaproteobacteria bacterium]
MIAGIDEAGRGPLAGPVVAAAVIFPEETYIPGINDSKKLTPAKRENLYDQIYENAISIGLGIIDSPEIDKINILQASLLSMRIAVANLFPRPDYLLIDGIFTIRSQIPQKAIKKGDSQSLSIAAASIIAKVSRDRLMKRYSEDFPGYGFHKHKGYGTRMHLEAIRTLGPTLIHRKTFRGVK